MAYSEKFELVKGYYTNNLWSADKVRNAVGKWITQAELAEILNIPPAPPVMVPIDQV